MQTLQKLQTLSIKNVHCRKITSASDFCSAFNCSSVDVRISALETFLQEVAVQKLGMWTTTKGTVPISPLVAHQLPRFQIWQATERFLRPCHICPITARWTNAALNWWAHTILLVRSIIHARICILPRSPKYARRNNPLPRRYTKTWPAWLPCQIATSFSSEGVVWRTDWRQAAVFSLRSLAASGIASEFFKPLARWTGFFLH